MTLLRTLSMAVLATTALSGKVAAAPGSLIEVGDAAPNYPWYNATGVSGNGNYVTGFGYDGNNFRSFFYSPDGLFDLGLSGTDDVFARAVSNNGVVVGDAVGSGTTAFRWSRAAGFENLGRLEMANPIDTAYANAVSNDGTRIVGSSYKPSRGRFEAYVWVEGATTGVAGNEQMYALGVLSPGMESSAGAISANGLWSAGTASDAVGFGHAVRWSLADYTAASASILDLGTLGGLFSEAYDVSNDGRVVVGYATNTDSDSRAFRWVEGGTGGAASNPQMYDLGTLGGAESWANGLNADGSVVVGEAQSADGQMDAFRWTEGTGMISVADWLAANGVDPGSVRLVNANKVSDDGSVIVGQMGPGFADRAYIARVTAEQGGLMDVPEYTRTLLANARTAQMGVDLTWMPLNGAHHRPLMAQERMDDDVCLWSVSDAAYNVNDDSGIALTEIGGCGTLGNGVEVGLGVGGSTSWQGLALGGAAHVAGTYVMGEVDWNPDGTPLLLSLTGVLGSWQANINRAYTNGGATDMSHGRTGLTAGVIRARVDWLDAAQLGAVSINPWISGAIGRTDMGGYVESGGAFPARFDGQSQVQYEVRLGVTARAEITPQTTLSTTLEVAHRSGGAPGANGQVLGLFDFGLGGGNQGATWARVGLDLDHAITEDVRFSGSLHVASFGQDATLSGSLGLRATF